MEQVRRSYVPEDEAFFYREESLGKLCQAQKDLLYLIERGYPMKNASVFTGNHYLLSERQRLALVRATSSRQAAALRGNREVIGPVPGKEVHIDGFNIIITLEIAARRADLPSSLLRLSEHLRAYGHQPRADDQPLPSRP